MERALASLGDYVARVKISRGRNMVFRKVSFWWVKMHISKFVVSGPKFTGFFAERGRNPCGYVSFPILDIFIRPGDIRDRILKLSEIAPNFARFLTPNFFGEGPQILGPRL